MSRITRGNRRLYAFDAGQGPAVVLLHGFATSGLAWMPQVAALSDAGFRIIAPDLAAHGNSDPLQEDRGIDGLVADVWAICDALAVERTHLVGLSLGGLVAMMAALHAPERVDRLVLASSFSSTTAPQFRAAVGAWGATLRAENGPAHLLDQLWPHSLDAAYRTTAEARQTYQAWQAMAVRSQGAQLADLLDDITGLDLLPQAGNLAHETLLITGGADPLAPMVTQTLLPALPKARLEEIEGGHHFVNVDRADAFNQALVRFLAPDL